MREGLEFAREQLIGKHSVIGAEIGVYRADNAIEMIKEWPELKELHLVDSYVSGIIQYRQAALKIYALREDPQYKRRVYWHVMTHHLAAQRFPNGLFHFAYIDDDHQFFAVLDALYTWIPKIRTDGVLCGHDRWQGGVNRAIKSFNELYGDVILNGGEDNRDWWFVVTDEIKDITADAIRGTTLYGLHR